MLQIRGELPRSCLLTTTRYRLRKAASALTLTGPDIQGYNIVIPASNFKGRMRSDHPREVLATRQPRTLWLKTNMLLTMGFFTTILQGTIF